ncbi:predicted protein [Chaetoceros tenuissimus]|uniref:Uncharacterized protein n=1 Tax=Chaetoceros tenuissimus TaxID=426638 RepID=A0AAD3HBJ7_9STRA|nr:predicted protein [Chaetoceros tenuissimus]
MIRLLFNWVEKLGSEDPKVDDHKFETVEGCTRDQERQVAQDVDWQRIIARKVQVENQAPVVAPNPASAPNGNSVPQLPPLAPSEIDQARDQAEGMRHPRDIAGLYSCRAACTSSAFSVSDLSAKSKLANDDARRFFSRMEVLQDHETLDMSDFPTLTFTAHASTDDNPRLDEAMGGPNAEGFWQASTKEIMTLQKITTWTQLPL